MLSTYAKTSESNIHWYTHFLTDWLFSKQPKADEDPFAYLFVSTCMIGWELWGCTSCYLSLHPLDKSIPWVGDCDDTNPVWLFTVQLISHSLRHVILHGNGLEMCEMRNEKWELENSSGIIQNDSSFLLRSRGKYFWIDFYIIFFF